MDGYSSPFRIDRNCDGGVSLFIWEAITVKLGGKPHPESFYVEFMLQKQNRLFNSSGNPFKTLIREHLTSLGENRDFYSSNPENITMVI